jgi:hypothetical protein
MGLGLFADFAQFVFNGFVVLLLVGLIKLIVDELIGRNDDYFLII